VTTGGFCNAYGAEQQVTAPYGGLQPGTIATQPECHAPAAHRFRFVCERGHRGQIVSLCEWHAAEFSGHTTARFEGGEGLAREHNGRVMTVPWNMRRDIQVCYRCASEAPECDNPEHQRMMMGRPGRCGCRQEKVPVRLELVS
jgi:hypothetical protein